LIFCNYCVCLSSLYAVYEMLLRDGQTAETQEVAKRIEGFVSRL